MQKYKYRAINSSGRPIKGIVSAANETDLFNQLQAAGLELVDCKPASRKQGGASPFRVRGVSVRELIQLFIHMEQMQGAGIAVLDALADIRDTTENPFLRDTMSDVYKDVSEGNSLSEAMAKHPKVFKHMYVSVIAAGEETGDLTSSYRHLIKYLKWLDVMQARIRKALWYPTILLIVVTGMIFFMMIWVVPQVTVFLAYLDQELWLPTTTLIATSDFFVAHWVPLLVIPIALFFLFTTARRMSDSFAYNIDKAILAIPAIGGVVRKINIARFSQTFGALFASGLDILKALESARETVTNRALVDALKSVQDYVKAGSPLSEAFNGSGEFPSMVVRMINVGEESGNLTTVLDQVSEFYTSDVDRSVQKLISSIEPLLTLVFAVIIIWVALGVFGPIYSNLGDML